MKRLLLPLMITTALLFSGAASAKPPFADNQRQTFNFNPGWKVFVGDEAAASKNAFDDSAWKKVTLPYAWNEDEAFKVSIHNLTTGIAWYRKTFRIPETEKGKKIFLEFEGVRQAGTIFVNGQQMLLHENGVMAFGIDITDRILWGQDNVIAVRTDNDWRYREASSNSTYQWNNTNFNANYGGMPKNVYLHVTPRVYQTLPLLSGLGTTGVYIYATDFDIAKATAMINAESQVRNESDAKANVSYSVIIEDMDGKIIATFNGTSASVKPGETVTLKASKKVAGLNFWSWGYGYLYNVYTVLKVDGKAKDVATTRTGFRKTKFGDGMVWLNDRVIQMKGYAQRTSNEWPAVGMSVPAWLSDYSNALMVEGNANLVRWMHVTPWKQDIESSDRVGLIQAMPAGDAEKDAQGRQWEQRKELMADAIIYNRNNPSIIFYECGNESISADHMAEMKAIRDKYDPYGGRAIGSREMLDIDVAEYGGEMLYINKSAKHPMWAMEYSRDEGLRKYWDSYSFPYHREGAGPLYNGADASSYNHNQDMHAIENIRRWYDYYAERPGTGKRVSSGGVNIIFSDSNTHYRGEENYRRSGEVDAMRIPKDGFWAHKAMWDGWVDIDSIHTHIIGHWTYPRSTKKDVYVISAAPDVELFLNGRSLGKGEKRYMFLNTFKDVAFEPGTLKAVSRDENGHELSSYILETAGDPVAIRMKAMTSPNGMAADGADLALIEFEVVDAQGRRCPVANDMITFELTGGEWRGGIAQGPENYILSKQIPVEGGVNRVLIRSTTKPETITVTAASGKLKPATVSIKTREVAVKDGLSEVIPGLALPSYTKRGPTPKGASYKVSRQAIEIVSATAGVNPNKIKASYDDNELSEWTNDGRISTGWATYNFANETTVSQVTMKLTGWRQRSYPIAIFVDEKEVWKGNTERSLGYITMKFEPTTGKSATIKLVGQNKESDAYGSIVELAGNVELDLFRDPNAGRSEGQLRIVEIEFYK